MMEALCSRLAVGLRILESTIPDRYRSFSLPATLPTVFEAFVTTLSLPGFLQNE